MTQVQIARAAETDLLEGYVFYEQQQAGIGDYFLDSLYADIDALALYAGVHAKPDGRLYRTLADRSPSPFTTTWRATLPRSWPCSTAARTQIRSRGGLSRREQSG